MKQMMLLGLIAMALVSAETPLELFQQGLVKERSEGKLDEAIQLYRRAAESAGKDRALAAKALVQLAAGYQKLGNTMSRNTYEKVVREYADQKEAAATARARLAASLASNTPRPLTTKQIWADEGTNTVGAPSLDGRYLSYVDLKTGDLAIREEATGAKRRLTNSGDWVKQYADWSAFSPDSRHIAYAWFAETFYELRILPTDAKEGVKPRVLLRNEEYHYNQPFAWTADGKHIFAIISRKDKTNQIASIAVADGSVRILKSLEWRYPNKVDLSPDGRYIVYDTLVAKGSSNRDIFLLATDGSSETPLVHSPGLDHAPVWTPDGRAVLFVSERSGRLGLWKIRVEMGKPQGEPDLVKADTGTVEPLGVTRDGTYYYGVGGIENDVYLAAIEPATGRLVRSPERISGRFVGSNGGPAWSPDGQTLAYLAIQGSQVPAATPSTSSGVIVFRTQKSGQERYVALKNWPMIVRTMRWSPDGRQLIFIAGNPQSGVPFSLHRIDVETGENLIKQTVAAKPWDLSPSPDGKRIYYIRRDPQTKIDRIMAYEIESGVESPIENDGPKKLQCIAVSPDGNQLALVALWEESQATSLYVMSTTGGAAIEILPAKPGRAPGQFGVDWTPDGKYLIFGQAAGSSMDLWRIPATGGTPEQLGLRPGIEMIASPRIHQDQRQLAFVAAKKRWEVWVIQNLLPIAEAHQ